MAKDPLMLTLDFGTQSVRAALIDKKGTIIDIKKVTYDPPYKTVKPGYAEQDPYFYLEVLAKASRPLVEDNKDKMGRVIGVSMSFFRDSPVILGEDDEPLRDAILWLDERRAEASEKLPFWKSALFRLVGMTPTIELNRKRTFAQWIKENEPDIWVKVKKYMTLSTFVTMHLVGKYVDSPASQAGHIPIDFKNCVWYKRSALKNVYGIPEETLCELVPVGEVMGEITEKASKITGLPKGLKMFACGSDKSAETLGLGCLDYRTAAVSYGTASSLEITTKKYSDAEPFLPSYPSVVKGYYNMEVQIYRGYWMLNWFTREFGFERVEKLIEKAETLRNLDEAMSKIAPGCDGLLLQPYWGPGLRRPLAKGAIVGFSDRHTAVHLYRAILEGIAYALREGLEFFEKKRTHKKTEKIRISGGGSRSDAICQITADIFGLPVSKIQTNECSSLGAAISGFIAAKEFSSAEEAVEAMVHQTIEFRPNEENHKRYDYLFKKVYMKMYPSLKESYKDLSNFEKLVEKGKIQFIVKSLNSRASSSFLNVAKQK